MSESGKRVTLAQPQPDLKTVASTPADVDLVPPSAGLKRHDPERLVQLFRHIRHQREGDYLFDMMCRYRGKLLP